MKYLLVAITLCLLSLHHHADAACPNLCNENGLCGINNVCICHEGFSGPDCSRRECFDVFSFDQYMMIAFGYFQVFALLVHLGPTRQRRSTRHMQILNVLALVFATHQRESVAASVVLPAMRVSEVSEFHKLLLLM